MVNFDIILELFFILINHSKRINKMQYLKFLTISLPLFLLSCHSTKKIADAKTEKENLTIPEFEGKITYSLTFVDKTGEMSKEQAKMFMGDQQVYTIKGDKYKSEMNGMMKITQYYLGHDTLYTQIGGMNNILWIDVTSNPDQLISFTIDKNADIVAGIHCDLVTIKSTEGITKYYFNKKYKINPINYSKHEYGFWKLLIDKTKALPLKSISDTKDLYIEIVAKEIKEMKVADAEFIVPDLPRVKSPEQ